MSNSPSTRRRRAWILPGLFVVALLAAGGALLLLLNRPAASDGPGLHEAGLTATAAPTYAPATPDLAASDPVRARLLAWCSEINPDIAAEYCAAEFAAAHSSDAAVQACHTAHPESEIEFRRCVAAGGIRPQSHVN